MRRPALVVALLVWAGTIHAQAAAPRFTITDVLDTRQLGAMELSPDGRLVLAGIASLRDRIGTDNRRFGDPTYVPPGAAELQVIEAGTGKATPLVTGKRQATGFAWSPDGGRLAFLLREGEAGRLAVWERATGRLRYATLPKDREVSASSPVQWAADGRVLFATRTTAWRDEARQRFAAETEGPIIVRSSEEPFLSWDAIRRLTLRQIPARWDVAADRVTELGGEGFQDGFAVSEDGAWFRWQEDITEKTDYAEIFGRVNRLKAKRLAGGEAVTLFATTKGVTIRWSGDGLTYVHAKDGTMSVSRLGDTAVRRLSALPPATPDSLQPADTTARRVARETREKERFSPLQVSHRGEFVVASNSEGLWLFETATGTKEKIADLPEESKQPDAPRYAVAAWSRDGRDLYLSYSARTGWERGFVRYDRAAKQLVPLVKDAHLYGELQLSADGQTAVFSRAPGNQVPDLYVAGRDLASPRRLTELNPGLEAKVGRTALVEYRDADGRPLKGVLYYPLDYREGTKYPTVFIVYEGFFDDRFNGTIALLNAHGYAVMQPSVHLVQGYPGEAWLKGVTAAANKLIDLGVADPKRLGVHGTSYGGYATNLLVAQTDRFAAAINISGKADMISFYTDSPRLGTRNTHAPEKSQDRIGGTLWEQPLKYLEHSAVMMADRIRTPLLLMTGREDHNVPERTTSEMFYALRRLDRRVEWVSYVLGGHGMPTARLEDVEDYHRRIVGWYDRHLKGEK
ncbi:MAG TPA: prolyl oligopeptidase family serine peptidase [Gemmatimonadales bacterium]